MYPVMLNLAGQPVAVVGGGHVAARKITALLAAQAQVTVISPTLNSAIPQAQVQWLAQAYRRELVQHMVLIIACTDQPQLNAQIRQDASPGQWVNNTSDHQASDFYNMAQVQQGQVTVAISTNGHAPSRAKKLKQQLKTWLKAHVD